MAKIKYYYDENTATYKQAKNKIGFKILFFLIIVSIVGFLISFPISEYRLSKSPEIQKLENEKEILEEELKLFNKHIDDVKLVLKDLQRRDDLIYRSYFNAKPIAEDVRNAGYGGVNRYKNLENKGASDLVISTHKKLNKLKKQLVIQSKSLDEIVDLAKNKEDYLRHIPAIQPVSKHKLKRIASGYGWRTHPILRVKKMHWGLDFSAPTGTPIYTTADGEIVTSNRSSSYGNIVEIKHGYGYLTRYAHMHTRKVTKGQKVKRGDVIGAVGSTGLSSGPHLHYELEKNGEKVNPINYFYQDLSPEEYAEAYEQAHNEIQNSLD